MGLFCFYVINRPCVYMPTLSPIDYSTHNGICYILCRSESSVSDYSVRKRLVREKHGTKRMVIHQHRLTYVVCHIMAAGTWLVSAPGPGIAAVLTDTPCGCSSLFWDTVAESVMKNEVQGRELFCWNKRLHLVRGKA